MAGRKAKIHQLGRAAFHIFGGCAVIKDDERVGPIKTSADYLQPNFHLLLRAHDNEHSWIIFAKAVQGLVVQKGGANDHDVIELAAEWPE